MINIAADQQVWCQCDLQFGSELCMGDHFFSKVASSEGDCTLCALINKGSMKYCI